MNITIDYKSIMEVSSENSKISKKKTQNWGDDSLFAMTLAV